ncbi:Spy/CpxP family protein refolding chaperone [Hyphomicrobium sp.]|uniref:Spy/CpxP family protein refolding chaperone n=1 Tax=Hyphomicrobium sp. TaxID=82 RepID=UPI001DA3338C|nr:Spy/CpxP family protein refolding chaperone [Hyphomicrobium sp.]MBY0558975.1 Spy/CpxP family protein refolding chaperone [Hyphomicrobium sp.]
MKNLSRGTWIALAAVVAVPATVAIAKPDIAGWRQMTPDTRARLQEGRIAMVKAALQLTPDQEKLWAPVETQVRDAFKAHEARMEEWKKKREERKAEEEKGGEQKRPDLADRFQKMSQRMTERADRMKAFTTAFSPFYASLSDEQKDALRPLLKQLMPGGHHGHRFADGWGPGGRHHGGWSDHGGKGGPQMHDDDDQDHGAPPSDKKG